MVGRRELGIQFQAPLPALRRLHGVAARQVRASQQRKGGRFGWKFLHELQGHVHFLFEEIFVRRLRRRCRERIRLGRLLRRRSRSAGHRRNGERGGRQQRLRRRGRDAGGRGNRRRWFRWCGRLSIVATGLPWRSYRHVRCRIPAASKLREPKPEDRDATSPTGQGNQSPTYEAVSRSRRVITNRDRSSCARRTRRLTFAHCLPPRLAQPPACADDCDNAATSG